MKSVFILNSVIAAMLNERHDVDKIVNAIQSTLNEAKPVGDGEAKRGNVGLKDKGATYQFSESVRDTYADKSTPPARFAAWHDAMARVFKVHGEPADLLPITVVPVSLKSWLDAKFTRVTTTTPADNGNAKANGKRGNIEKVAPATVPTA